MRAAAQLETDSDQKTLAVWYLTLVPAVGIAAPVALSYVLYTALSAHGSTVGFGLLDIMRMLAE